MQRRAGLLCGRNEYCTANDNLLEFSGASVPPAFSLSLSLRLSLPLSIISFSSSSRSSPSAPSATTTRQGCRHLTSHPPHPMVALEIFQEQRSALGIVRFAKRGKSRDSTTGGAGIAFFCLVSACRTTMCKRLARVTGL